MMRSLLFFAVLITGLLVTFGFCAVQRQPLFIDATAVSGLDFRHVNGAQGSYYLPEIMGAGVGLFDFDNDGDLDVFAVQSGPIKGEHAAGKGNRLFRNELIPTGTLRFTDISDSARVSAELYGMGVAAADYDNDGFVDLFLTGLGKVALLRNNGDGSFSDRTLAAGIANPHWSTSATWFDYNRDGNLDLYLANYVDFSIPVNKACYSAAGELDYCSPSVYNPVSDRLYRNEGKGRFSDVSRETGIATSPSPGLGVVAFDFDRDGWQDLYVANDGAPNLLWHNKHGQSFEDIALEAGAALNNDGMPQAGMGVDAADLRRTGLDDVLVSNMRHETYNLYAQTRPGLFIDKAIGTGLAKATYTHTGFGLRFLDFDHDGWLDVFLANGSVTRRPDPGADRFPYHELNQLLRGANKGGQLIDVSASAAPALALPEIGRGLATGDIDNDGDIDVVISNNNGPLRLLLNQTSPSKPAIIVALRSSSSSNRFAIGARVGLHRSSEPPQWRRVQADASYLSASDSKVHFGLGDNPGFDRIEVIWPAGKREFWLYQNGKKSYLLEEGKGIK